MMAMRLDLRIISHSELNGRQVPGIGPLRFAGNHLPPYTYIFYRSYPGSVLDLARLIEIQRHTGSENVARVVTDNDCAPRRVHRCLKIAFRTGRIRIEEGFENEILVIQIQMHAGIVHKGSLMNVHIKSLVGLELKRGLHAGRREHVLVHALAVHFSDLGKTAARIVIFLCIMVRRNPPGSDISRHGELCAFLLYDKIDQ